LEGLILSGDHNDHASGVKAVFFARSFKVLAKQAVFTDYPIIPNDLA
jgi:beta-lactamase superfamily II metal-dependent hydrolase